MIYRITRVDKDGTKTLVGFTEDECEIGVIVYEDRKNYDCDEDTYEIKKEET